MRNLNSFVPGYPDYLYSADDINDHGKISGLAIEQGTQANVPFIATPEAVGSARSRAGSAREVALPAPVRQALLERLGIPRMDLAR
jgi:hypothetical protein